MAFFNILLTVPAHSIRGGTTLCGGNPVILTMNRHSAKRTEDTAARTVKILQVTDTHCYADPGKTLLGLNTDQSFQAVLRLARRLHWPVDLVLATGDLVHGGSAQGYHRLKRHLEETGVPVYSLPGNHDDGVQLKRILSGDNLRPERSACYGNWQIILLDSSVPDQAAGLLGAPELERLERCLSEYPQHHALVCLHHHPVPIGSRWMDTMRLLNAPEFFQVLDRHAQVRSVLWGHIHQEFNAERKGVKLLGSPSTCVQFKPRSEEFALDEVPPGYRWLALRPDGAIETGVRRLDSFPQEINLRSTGY